MYMNFESFPKHKNEEETKKKFYGAIYMLSDQKVADALIAAAKRKVDVQLVVDPYSFSKFGKADYLGKNNINLFVYVPTTTSAFDDIMHNKFALFDEKLTWCGSANWTNAADKKNQESVIASDSKAVYTRFNDQFKILKQRSITYKEYCDRNKQFTRDVSQTRRSPDTTKSKSKGKRTLDEIIEREHLSKVLDTLSEFFRSLFW